MMPRFAPLIALLLACDLSGVSQDGAPTPEGKADRTGRRVRIVRPSEVIQGEVPDIALPRGPLPKGFKNVLLVALRTTPNGAVADVTVRKSTGLQQLDKQVVDVVKRWRFGKSREGLEAALTVILEIK